MTTRAAPLTTASFVLLSIVLTGTQLVHGFHLSPHRPINRLSTTTLNYHISNPQLAMIPETLHTVIPHIQSTQILLSSASLRSMDPLFEAEIMTDFSHIALDLSAFASPTSLYVRVFAIVGRLLCISADYVPDRFIAPEEMLYQALMLSIACGGLFQGIVATLRDHRCYRTLFRPHGISWEQFERISAVDGVFVWEDMKPREEIVLPSSTSSSFVWVYSGSVDVGSDDGSTTLLTAQARRGHWIDNEDLSSASKTTTLRAGACRGATILKMDVEKLQEWMHDEDDLLSLVRSMHRL